MVAILPYLVRSLTYDGLVMRCKPNFDEDDEKTMGEGPKMGVFGGLSKM